ncbi:Crp/Fnr family transcriptional regulator [Rhodopseudomonas sp.]|uniref:Crp/Fnr family transcriptional regulator n=1 Tax=Rhodopseudomonas sp. TaxID=1078 RepID=UPI003B3B7FD5
MERIHRILIDKLREHSRITSEDAVALQSLSFTVRELDRNEDFIRQGDTAKVSALVVEGMVARYHLLPNGRRQYLSFHMAGDMPDSQTLFLDRMDHAVCSIGAAVVASIPHKQLARLFELRPLVGFAVWRETLIDAAIFREAITNNSARDMTARMAHLFCELFYRAEASRLTRGNVMSLPIGLAQLGETLGMAIATVNRTLAELRSAQAIEFRGGELEVLDWARLVELGQFDPGYLHLRKTPLIAEDS